jgi:hypothetical protein
MIRVLRRIHGNSRLKFLIEFRIFVAVTLFVLALSCYLMLACLDSEPCSIWLSNEGQQTCQAHHR